MSYVINTAYGIFPEADLYREMAGTGGTVEMDHYGRPSDARAFCAAAERLATKRALAEKAECAYRLQADGIYEPSKPSKPHFWLGDAA